MTVYDTVRRCLIKYPTIFKTKGDVYHQMFSVNGCGYDWVKGEIIEDGLEYLSDKSHVYTLAEGIRKCNNDKERRLSEIEGYEYADGSLSNHADFMVRHINKVTKKNIATVKAYEENIKKIEVSCDIIDLYPLCQYALINNIPNDITDGWQNAVNEYITYLKDNYDELSDNYKDFLKNYK